MLFSANGVCLAFQWTVFTEASADIRVSMSLLTTRADVMSQADYYYHLRHCHLYVYYSLVLMGHARPRELRLVTHAAISTVCRLYLQPTSVVKCRPVCVNVIVIVRCIMTSICTELPQTYLISEFHLTQFSYR